MVSGIWKVEGKRAIQSLRRTWSISTIRIRSWSISGGSQSRLTSAQGDPRARAWMDGMMIAIMATASTVSVSFKTRRVTTKHAVLCLVDLDSLRMSHIWVRSTSRISVIKMASFSKKRKLDRRLISRTSATSIQMGRSSKVHLRLRQSSQSTSSHLSKMWFTTDMAPIRLQIATSIEN